MPTKNPRKHRTEKQPITVTLTPEERTDIGIELLRIKDGKQRTQALKELTQMLSVLASELGNANNVYLRSDFLSLTAPLVTAVDRFLATLQSIPSDVLSMVSIKKFVDFKVLGREMNGFKRFNEWLRKEPSKKGGERSAYVRAQKEICADALTAWFEQHRLLSSDTKPKKDAKKFVRVAFAAMDRSVEAAGKKA